MRQPVTAQLQNETKKLFLAGGLAHTAANAMPGHAAPGAVHTTDQQPSFDHEFTPAPVQPAALLVGRDYATAACPVFPRTCPFGGACHTCPARVQAGLMVNEPGDEYEQEADRMADRVVRTPGAQLQRRSTARVEQIDAPPISHEALQSSGQPLDWATRAFMEPRFGYDFSQVRLHADPEAGAINDILHSRAFTHEQHIWLGRGESSRNLPLLAHELTHTIQQGAVTPLERPLREAVPAVGARLRTAHTRPTGIQRSVQETGVRSPEDVLLKIALSLIQNSLLPIPLQLLALGNAFNPGGGVDDPRNNFVYTCRGGWIDMGHFFFTASGVSTRVGALATWKRALQTEEQQQREREKYERMPLSERERYFGRSKEEATPEQAGRRGTAGSAYSIEDLPSDKFGLDFGLSLRPFDDVLQRMIEFFRRQGAVDASRDKDVLRRMMDETLGTEKDRDVRPRQHRSTTPVLLASARGLCGPRSMELKYSPRTMAPRLRSREQR